jgi:hypothetical protein
MKHLIPHDLDVRNTLPLQKTREMLLDDEGTDVASRGDRKPDRAIARFHFHNQ